MLVLSLVPLLMGAAIACQSAVNARLRRQVGSPFFASLVSFGVGFIFLGILLLLSGTGKAVTFEFIASSPWWLWLGGLTAACALTANVLLFEKLGATETTVLPMAGQIAMGTVIDEFGMFGAPLLEMNWQKALGLFVIFLGLTAATGALKGNKGNSGKGKNLYRLLGFGAGSLLAVQTAVNGSLGQWLGSPLEAAWLAFGVSFLALLAICKAQCLSILEMLSRLPKTWREDKRIFTGGVLGSSYVLLSAILAPILGTSTVLVVALLGQLITSACQDNWGLMWQARRRLSQGNLAGLLLMVFGTCLVRIV